MKSFLRRAILISMVLGILLTGSVMAAGKSEYIKIEENTIKAVLPKLEKASKNDIAKILLPINKIARKESEANIEIANYNDFVEGNKIDTKTKIEYDVSKNIYYLDFESKFNDEKVMSGIFSMNGNEILGYIPEIMEQYLFIDTSKSEVMGNVDYMKNLEYSKEFQFANSEKKIIKDSILDYYKVLKDSLPEEAFEIQNNVEVNYNGKTIKCDMITMDLSGQDIETIIIKLLETVKNDDKLFDLLLSKTKNILNSDESLSIYSDMLTKESLCTYINNYISYLNSDTPIIDSRFIVKDYYKDSKVLQRQFADPYTGDTYLTITTVPNEYYGIKYFQEDTSYEYYDNYCVDCDTCYDYDCYNCYDCEEYGYCDVCDYYNYSFAPRGRYVTKREEVDLNIQVEKDNNITKYFVDLGNWQEGPEGIFEIDNRNKTLKGKIGVEAQNIELNIDSKFENKNSIKKLDTILNLNSEKSIINVTLKDSMQENIKPTKLNVKNKKDITNYTQGQLMELTQEISQRAIEKGIDENKAISVVAGLSASISDARLFSSIVIYPSIINITNSLNNVRAIEYELSEDMKYNDMTELY